MNRDHLFYCAISAREGYETSPQLGRRSDSVSLYIKNAIVAVCSAMEHSGARGAIISTFDCPDRYRPMIVRFGIEWYKVAFDRFLLPSKFKWALAFYKLRALAYVSELPDVKTSTLLDTDTLSVRSLEDLVAESRKRILVFEVDHALSHPHRKEIQENYERLSDREAVIVHIGGEIVSGPSDLLKILVRDCEKLFGDMKSRNEIMDPALGDEFILSVVLSLGSIPVARANPYIYRYWTSPSFYLVSTNWINNPVSIWHLPVNKSNGMIALFEVLERTGSFPSIRKMARTMGLPSSLPPLANWISFGVRRLVRCLLPLVRLERLKK